MERRDSPEPPITRLLYSLEKISQAHGAQKSPNPGRDWQVMLSGQVVPGRLQGNAQNLTPLSEVQDDAIVTPAAFVTEGQSACELQVFEQNPVFGPDEGRHVRPDLQVTF